MNSLDISWMQSYLRPLGWQEQAMCVDLRCVIMGSTTCSDPGFAVLQPSLKAWETEKKGSSFILLWASFIRTALAKTAKGSSSQGFLLLLRSFHFFPPAISKDLPALFTLCRTSAFEAVFLSLRVARAFLLVPRAFLRVPRAFLFKAPNVFDWLQSRTGIADVSVVPNLIVYCLSVFRSSVLPSSLLSFYFSSSSSSSLLSL